MIYRFKKSRTPKPKFDKIPPQDGKVEEPIGVVQGQIPDSIQEWWVAKALNRIGVPYIYQYPLNGGRVRGGYLIDFVVQTVPLATMIEPAGNHWHTGELSADDKKRQADIESLMADTCRIPIGILWIPDLLDEETTFVNTRRLLYGN
jgi:hypothetical protein